MTRPRPPRPPPGSADALLAESHRLKLEIGPSTNRNGGIGEFDLGDAVAAVFSAVGCPEEKTLRAA